jgi:hypothetical protein
MLAEAKADRRLRMIQAAAAGAVRSDYSAEGTGELEAAAGVEPANRGFADLRLTTWLRRLQQMTIREFRAAVQLRWFVTTCVDPLT